MQEPKVDFCVANIYVLKIKNSGFSSEFFVLLILFKSARFFYKSCIKRCFSNNTFSVSTCSSSGIQQSTGQTAAHCGSS